MQKAIELSPENIILCVQAYTNIGSSLSEKGMYEEALKNLDKALELPSKNAKAISIAYSNKAYALIGLKT